MMTTPTYQSGCTPMGTLRGTPDSKMRDAHQDQSNFDSELHTKIRVVHKYESAIHSDWPKKTVIAHQEGSVVRSELRMTKFSFMIGTVWRMQDLVKPNEDVSIESKLPICVALQEDVQEDSDKERGGDDNEENVKNEKEENDIFVFCNYKLLMLVKPEEVEEDSDDACDYFAQCVVSSYNFPDEEKQDKFPASEQGEVDEEPGGNVSASCRSQRFRLATA
jgi:hypothetical protein